VLLKKSDRLVTIGITDARFHGSLRLLGRLWLRRLGGLRLGRGRLVHNPSILDPTSRITTSEREWAQKVARVKTKIDRPANTTRLSAWNADPPRAA
jgi:hypothetical protein